MWCGSDRQWPASRPRFQARSTSEGNVARLVGQNEALVGRVRHLSTQVAASEATLAEYVAVLAFRRRP